MDQVKEILRQVVKFRFWISIAVATLFAGGAYVLGSGPIQKSTDEATNKINSAAKDVQQYSSPATPTADFEPIVAQKTEVLTKDVDRAWKELYERQAPLLTWPESVAGRFQKWGRKWPEEAAPSAVQLAIVDYTEAYPDFAKQIFKTFKPFDYETGEGIVASPPSDMLLRTTRFDINAKLPKLQEVWSAQERLWVQGTVLDVVAKVNRNATDWESAYLKEIKALEVGNVMAQDQKSLAKGEELEAADPITAPDEPEEEEGAGGAMGSGDMGSSMMMSAMMAGSGSGSGSGGMMGSGMMGSGMGGMGGMQVSQDVLFLKPEGSDQYKILPIMLTVLIDQDHVQDLLVELENSPMSIEVKEPEIRRPQARIVKPEKGMAPSGYGGGMMGMMGMDRGMMMGGGPEMGYGGMNSMMMNGGMMGSGGMMGGRGGMDMMGGMSGMMMPGMGGAAASKKGEDRRSVDRKEEREKALKKIDTITGKSLFDPYFNIVELTVYGQARFYNEPPPPAADAETASPGDPPAAASPGDPPAAAAPGDPPAAAPAGDPSAAAPAGDPPAAAPAGDPSAAAPTPAAEAGKADTPSPAAAPAPAQPEASPEAPKA